MTAEVFAAIAALITVSMLAGFVVGVLSGRREAARRGSVVVTSDGVSIEVPAGGSVRIDRGRAEGAG